MTSIPDRRTADVRPGAMTAAMSAAPQWLTSERALRVALATNGCIESERLVRGKLVVGRSEKADVVVADARFDGALFLEKAGRWHLVVPAGVRGRIADSGGQRALESEAQRREIPLGPDARGRIELERGAILFHLVLPPPAMPKPQLPASVRGGFFGQIDWHFTSITIAVFMLFFGATIMLESADWPIKDALRQQSDLSCVFAFADVEPPQPAPGTNWAQRDPEPEVTRDDEPTPPTDTATERPQERSQSTRNQPRNDAPVSLDHDTVANLVTLDLGTLAGGDGALHDLLQNGSPTNDAVALFADATGVQQASSDATNFRPRASRQNGSGESLRDIARSPMRAVPSAHPVSEDRVAAHVHLDDWDEIDSDIDFDPAALLRRIRGRSRQIARCYEVELSRDGSLRGRVDARITVQPSGGLSVRIGRNTTDSQRVAGCVERNLATITLRDGPETPPVLSFPFLLEPQH